MKYSSLIILMFLSAFFSGSETALSKLPKVKSSNDPRLKEIIDNSDEMISTILILNNIVNIAFSSIATLIITESFGMKNLPVIMTFTTVIFILMSEITPKIILYDNSYKFGLFVAPIILFFMKAFSPINKIISVYTDFLKKKLKMDKLNVDKEEIKDVVSDAHDIGVINNDELKAFNGILSLREKKITEIFYVKKDDMITVNYNDGYNKVLSVLRESEYSRIPVFKEKNIIGMLYSSDFLCMNKDNFKIKKSMRKILYVDEATNISEVVKNMKESRIHMAIIRSTKGKVLGLTTLEICTEVILGDIYDETDD